jgi:hypothetical protein
MHMVIMLRLPTSFKFQVFRIWGRYWVAEKAAEVRPRKVVHKPNEELLVVTSMNVVNAENALEELFREYASLRLELVKHTCGQQRWLQE